MEDSRSKHEETLQEILESYRDQFAGKKTVMCATGLGPDAHFDFSNVKPEDINYSINGENYVIAKAKNISSEEISVCYLKYVTKKAQVIESQMDALTEAKRIFYQGNNIQESQKKAAAEMQERIELEVIFKTPKRYSSGRDYDLIDVISDYRLNFNRGNAVKYVFRAGKKGDEIEDLKKAIDYLQREIKIIEKSQQ